METVRSHTAITLRPKKSNSGKYLVQLTDDLDDDSWKPPRCINSLYEFRDRPVRTIVTGRIYLQDQDIPYMLVDVTIKVEDVVRVMTAKWNIALPRAILVIISDPSPLLALQKMNMEEKLVGGLINASKNVCGMWIISKGLNVGLSKSIGEAFYTENVCQQLHMKQTKVAETIVGYRATLIGICQEDILSYSENLQFPKRACIKLENTGAKSEEDGYDLNPYYSHFIFVRDTSVPKYGFDNFLLHFEHEISTKQPSSMLFRVPVIAVLVQGNASCVHYILEHVRNSLPAVIVKGSGGLADLLAFAYYEVHRRCQISDDSEYMENLVKPSLFRKISIAFPSLQDNLIACDYLCDRILECVTHSKESGCSYLYILDAQDQNQKLENLSYHILEALFLSQRKNVINWLQQLKKDLLLSIEWNCADVAMSKVFLTYPKFKVDDSVFKTVLFMENREAFVSLFLQRGFKVHQFLSSNQLISLFSKSINEHYFYEVCWSGLLGYGKGMKICDDFIDSDLNFMIEMLTGISVYVSSEELDLNAIGMYSLTYKKKDDVAFAEQQALAVLIVWALLSCKLKLAEVIWQHSGLPVTVALTSSLILENLLPHTKDAHYREEILKQRQKFSEMATTMFNLAYNDMPCRAFDALDEKNSVWEDHTLVEIARLSQNVEFVSLPCCQKWISKAFMGNIRIRELTWGFVKIPVYIKVILSAFLVFPMYIWVLFQPNSLRKFTSSEGSDVENIVESKKVLKVVRPSNCRKKILQLVDGKYPSFWKMVYYMWNAPITKFWVYHIFYVLFLCLFSLSVIWPSCGNLNLDIVVCFWIFTIVVESIYCTYSTCMVLSKASFFLKISEMIFMSTFAVFYILARFSEIFFDPYVTKILLCIGLLYFYYRAMYIYLPVSSTLGPHLYTLKRLVIQDFKNFMCLTVLVMISNGVVLQAIIYPDFPINAELVRMAFHRAWITFFITPNEEYSRIPSYCISVFTRPVVNETFCSIGNYDDYTCPSVGFWSYLFSIQYYILLKLVLWTLLFAMFSSTHDEAQVESTYLWKFERHQLVAEYSKHTLLPPPLNVFYFLLRIFKCICKAPLKTKEYLPRRNRKYSNPKKSSHVEYKYWKQLIKQYKLQETFVQREHSYSKEKLSMLSEFNEVIKYQENLIHKGNSQIAELEADVTFTRLSVRTTKSWKHRESLKEIHFIHILSRQSPYFGTKIERFPVPDKYVPWEVKWLNYQPEEFTLPYSRFPSHLQLYVDDDLLFTSERQGEESCSTACRWNIAYTDSKGIYHGRDSWITDFYGDSLIYKLHNRLPQNPMGRTGITGKGSLPKWGPNHFIFAIITRWKKSAAVLKNHLEFIETWHGRRNELSLPGDYIIDENRYYVIQKCFKTVRSKDVWKTEADLRQFFRSLVIDTTEIEQKVQINMLVRGYMDDPLNTDQAWKEVEAWHIHYSAPLKKDLCVKPRMAWRVITEDVFTLLPCEQAKLLQKVMHSMNLSIS